MGVRTIIVFQGVYEAVNIYSHWNEPDLIMDNLLEIRSNLDIIFSGKDQTDPTTLARFLIKNGSDYRPVSRIPSDIRYLFFFVLDDEVSTKSNAKYSIVFKEVKFKEEK